MRTTESTLEPTLLMNDPNITMVTAGGWHSMILKKNGDLLGFGYHTSGQLGIPVNCDQKTPTLIMNDPSIKFVVCGKEHTFVYKNTGELFGFGKNEKKPTWYRKQ